MYSDIVLSVTLSCGAFLLGSGAVISYWLPDGSGKPRAHVLTNSGENTATQSGCTLPAQQQWARARREPWDTCQDWNPASEQGAADLFQTTQKKNGWALNRYAEHSDMDLPFYLLFSALGSFQIVSICMILCAFEQYFIFFLLNQPQRGTSEKGWYTKHCLKSQQSSVWRTEVMLFLSVWSGSNFVLINFRYFWKVEDIDKCSYLFIYLFYP